MPHFKALKHRPKVFERAEFYHRRQADEHRYTPNLSFAGGTEKLHAHRKPAVCGAVDREQPNSGAGGRAGKTAFRAQPKAAAAHGAGRALSGLCPAHSGADTERRRGVEQHVALPLLSADRLDQHHLRLPPLPKAGGLLSEPPGNQAEHRYRPFSRADSDAAGSHAGHGVFLCPVCEKGHRVLSVRHRRAAAGNRTAKPGVRSGDFAAGTDRHPLFIL